MSTTRNNHYVPEWYQKGFFEPGRNALQYLDLSPPKKTLSDGRVIVERALFDAPPSRAFRQFDLYSTFFGTSVNDEIERRLFGSVDTRGSQAVKAFMGTDVGAWHRHFHDLFDYVDIQKIRTPKGLDWLKAQYPELSQNELMLEMQEIRQINCAIWTEGVREIVSAEESAVKFIVSDHPVTIYNYSAPPDASLCAYPNDPRIAAKASQTLFPLSRDFCLVLTNLEYARDPSTSPMEKRTFARNFKHTMVRTDAFIRSRKLSDSDVTQINFILKQRARRHIAAGKREWLYPERSIAVEWKELRQVLLPPEEELWHYGGEMFARFDSGHVHYQDEFGRTEKERDFLKKKPPEHALRSGDYCGCGSGRSYKTCCRDTPTQLRPSWHDVSIRERNMMLLNAIIGVLDIREGRDWITIRRELTDDQISRVYSLYQGLWPLDTDLLRLLPKPDGTARAVYTGLLHPKAITDFALGASLYFGDLIIENPFIHAANRKKEFSPVENPKAFRHEFLKSVQFFLTVMPLVERGLINLIPDPCSFDPHLQQQMFSLARARSAQRAADELKDPRFQELVEEDGHRSFLSLPRGFWRRKVKEMSPELDEASVDNVLDGFERLKEADPLAVLQQDTFDGSESGGQYIGLQLAPNFEIAMYLAQATGSAIVTDRYARWQEILITLQRRRLASPTPLKAVTHRIQQSSFAFPQNVMDVYALSDRRAINDYRAYMQSVFRYISRVQEKGVKPNHEQRLGAEFTRAHLRSQAEIGRAGVVTREGRLSCFFAPSEIQDNTVNRLLLMSSSEHHLPSVPMAFFIDSIDNSRPS